MQKLIQAILVILAASVLGACATNDTSQARNPIIWADVPDVSVIRVGDTYYMSSTTMHMSPGLPIMKSDDLVNWQLVGYVYDTLVDNEAMNLQRGQDAYGAGSWASSLRYHDWVNIDIHTKPRFKMFIKENSHYTVIENNQLY